MGRLTNLGIGLFACMFPDHGVPHVHVFYGRPHERNPDVIVVRIQDATVLAGALPTPRLLRHALEYVRERREELLAAWVRLQKGQAPSKILPVRGSRQGSPVRVRAHITTRWPVRILLLERLGRGRVRMILADGRVFERSRFRHERTARLAWGGYAVELTRKEHDDITAARMIRGATYIGRMRPR